MCRNIRTLYNFKPPATDAEIRASALQFVRKLSGFTRPSKVNEPAFNRAVEQMTQAAHALLDGLVTNAPPLDRHVEAAKARARGAERFGGQQARLSGDRRSNGRSGVRRFVGGGHGGCGSAGEEGVGGDLRHCVHPRRAGGHGLAPRRDDARRAAAREGRPEREERDP